jgi:DNA polymerase III gamma/tau subunit
LCRELARATRDLLILSVDPKRASDPDVASDAERERLSAMVGQWSREDLLRAFDLLTKAEQEVRVSDQPRFNLEMALLRLMHLRKLVPLSELLSGSGAAAWSMPQAARAPLAPVPAVRTVPAVPKGAVPSVPRSPVPASPKGTGTQPVGTPGTVRTEGTDSGGDALRDRFLAEIKANKSTFYNLVLASAFRIDASPAGIVFTFLPNQKNAKSQCEEQKSWLMTIAEKVAGKAVPISVVVADAGAVPAPAPASPVSPLSSPVKSSPDDVKAEAMANSTVQALLEIFPVEKTTIEER